MIATRARVCLVAVAAAAAIAVTAWRLQPAPAPVRPAPVEPAVSYCLAECPDCLDVRMDEVTARADVERAIERVGADVRGCFDEWAERHPMTAIAVHVRVAHDRHELIVEHVESAGEDALGQCVAGAVSRARYPELVLDAVVTAAWAGGQLSLSTVAEPHTRFID